jgi:2-methylcitrate dehydratase PrpD
METSTLSPWRTDLAHLAWSDLAPEVRERARILLFDSLGIAAAGGAAPGTEPFLRSLQRWSGAGDVPVPWTNLVLPPSPAAMALSILVHAWDFDDTHDEGVVHTSAVVVPAALAAGLAGGAGGEDVLAAVVAGVQVMARLARALGPQAGVVRTAGLGAFGAAAAAARALRLDGERFEAALRIALPSALSPASRQAVADGSASKRFQPAQAVQAGVTAALLASDGVDGPPGWLLGPYGLLRHGPDRDAALELLAEPGWEVERLSLKPYPACRFAHSAVAAAVEAGAKGGGTSALVRVPSGPGYAIVARPFEWRGEPTVDVQFSIPWLVAAAMVRGGVDLETVTEPALFDPEIERLAGEVVVVADLVASPESEMAPAEVTVHGASGTATTRTLVPPGSPLAPLGWPDVEEKLGSCLRVGNKPAAGVARLRSLVADLDQMTPRELGRAVGALPGEGTPWTSN